MNNKKKNVNFKGQSRNVHYWINKTHTSTRQDRQVWGARHLFFDVTIGFLLVFWFCPSSVSLLLIQNPLLLES